MNLNFETTPKLTWLTDGSKVPDHLSVYVYNADFTKVGTAHELALPAHVLSMTPRPLTVTCCRWPPPASGSRWSSGVVIDHPLAKDGRAWEVLHTPRRRGDISKLEPVERDVVRFFRGGSVPEGHLVDGSTTSWLAGLFDYEADQLPTPSWVQVLKARLSRLLPW